MVLLALDGGEVFCNGLGLGTGGKFCNPDAIGSQFLMSHYTGLELLRGLKKMSIQIVTENILVFTQNGILQEIQSSDGT
jgi:hypothetical protein